MSIDRILPGLFVFLTLIAQARPQAAPGAASAPEDLPAAVEQQAKAREALRSQAADAQGALQKWYHSALDAVKTNATAKGQLDDVLAVDAERERVERDLTPEEAGKLPPTLRTVRAQYDQARAQQSAQQRASVAASVRAYVATLEALEKRLTQKSDVPNAVATRKERTAAEEELKTLATVAAPAPAVKPATAPATPPATPARFVSTSGSGSTAPVKVAAKVVVSRGADGGVKGAGSSTITFTPPNQKGAFGALGLLLENDPSAGSKGSTWTVGMIARGQTMLQLVHPYEGGHVIVQITPDNFMPCRVETWPTQPWTSAGHPDFFKRTAAAKVFPLKFSKSIIAGALDPRGNYTLSVDGKVVATGNFAAAPDRALYVSRTPLVIAEGFQGAKLPMQWRPGFAALLFSGTVPGSGAALNAEEAVFQAKAP
jgi:hypothetical protein